MSTKVIINVRKDTNMSAVKEGDILMYDDKRKEFYITTSELFFDKYERKLKDLLKRYDEDLRKIENEKELMIREFENLQKNIESEFSIQNNEIHNNYIDMNNQFEDFKEKILELIETYKKKNEKESSSFQVKILESNVKLIEMVENFIKGGNKK